MKWEQRKLEFRAYAPDHDGVHYSVINNVINLDIAELPAPILIEGRLAIFVQYTGVKDINGKKIFEGDICEFLSEYLNPKVGIIRYRADSADFRLYNSTRNYTFVIATNLKILGNVFQNPEALNDI